MSRGETDIGETGYAVSQIILPNRVELGQDSTVGRVKRCRYT